MSETRNLSIAFAALLLIVTARGAVAQTPVEIATGTRIDVTPGVTIAPCPPREQTHVLRRSRT